MSPISESTLQKALDQSLIPEVRTISAVLAKAGFKSWIVGGCVRDVALALLRGEQQLAQGDWDLATSAQPQQVQALFKRVIPTGIAHGTVTVVLGQKHFELTTLRGEVGHSDGRRPDGVFFVDDINSDLARRDFTVNAIAYNIETQTIHDPFLGIVDLLAQTLRAVGDPALRFSEDGLRVLRCARFCATLDFTIEPATQAAILPSLASFKMVAQERVLTEWLKALQSAHPQRFFSTVAEHGMLAITAPELFEGQNSYFDSSSLQIRLPQLPPEPLVRLALIVVGGTSRQSEVARQLVAATATARALAKRLKLSRDQSQLLLLLVSHHLPPTALSANPDPALVRRYIAQIGRSHVDSILEFQRVCAAPGPHSSVDTRQFEQLHKIIAQEAHSNAALSLKELNVQGQDLIELGVPKGPKLGEYLQRLLQSVFDDPSQNERTLLLDQVRRWLSA